MRTIIEGVRYDTAKAVEIGGTDNAGGSISRGDFSFWQAALYRTPRSGRYFLAGQGGGMTIFARHCEDGTRTRGERIVPLTEEDAFAWAQEYLPTAAVEKHFADLIEEA